MYSCICTGIFSCLKTKEEEEEEKRVMRKQTNKIIKICLCQTEFFPLIISAAFSPIIIVGALVFPEMMFGIIEASATRSPDIPLTLQ